MEMALEAWGLQAGDLEWVSQALSSNPCEEDLAPYLLLTGQQQGIGDLGGGGGVRPDQLTSSKRSRADTEGAKAGGRPGEGTHKRNRTWERQHDTVTPPLCIAASTTSHRGDDDLFDQDVGDDDKREKQASCVSSKRQRRVDVATQKRMERKKTREKMRRIEVNDGFTELMEALAEVNEPEDPTQQSSDASAKAAERAKGAIKLLGDKGNFRVELLNRAVKALRRLSDAAKADRARVEHLRGKLKALGHDDAEGVDDDDSGGEESAEVNAQRSAAVNPVNASSVKPEAQAGNALLVRTRLSTSPSSLSPPPTTNADSNTEKLVANVNMPREADAWLGLSAQGATRTLTHAHAHANRAAEVNCAGGLTPHPNTPLGSVAWMTTGDDPLWTLLVVGGGGGSGVAVREDVAVSDATQRACSLRTHVDASSASSSTSTRGAAALQPLPTAARDLPMAMHMQHLQQQHQQSHHHQHQYRPQQPQPQQQPPLPQPWMMGYLLSPFELPPRATTTGINARAVLPTSSTPNAALHTTTTSTPTITDPLHLLAPFTLPLPRSCTPVLPYHPLATDLAFSPIDGVFNPPRTLTGCVHGEPVGVGGMTPPSGCTHGGAEGCDDCVYDAQMHMLPWLMQGYCEGLEVEVPTHAPCA